MIKDLWPLIAAVAAIVMGWFAAKRQGKKEEQQRADKHRQKVSDKVKKVDDELHQADDDGIRQRLREWVRTGDD